MNGNSNVGSVGKIVPMERRVRERPATIAEVLNRCRKRAAPFDRRADRARAACGDEARERTERLWEGVTWLR
jgi:hypothetical protein